MGYKRKYTFFEVLNIIYFLLTLFVLMCKFGLIFDKVLAEKIFHMFYYWCSTITLGIAAPLILFFLTKSKKIRNNDEGESCAKNTLAVFNIAATAFQFLASMFGTLHQKRIAYEWLQLTIYVSMIAIIVNTLVYIFIRERVSKKTNFYNQKDTINMYIIYIIVVSFLVGIIIPNLMIHFGIIKMIRTY